MNKAATEAYEWQASLQWKRIDELVIEKVNLQIALEDALRVIENQRNALNVLQERYNADRADKIAKWPTREGYLLCEDKPLSEALFYADYSYNNAGKKVRELAQRGDNEKVSQRKPKEQ